MQSAFLKLTSKDFVNGLLTAICTGILPTLYEALNTGTFNVFEYDWAMILKLAVSAGVGYIIRKFFTTEQGKFAGIVKT